MFSNLKHNDNSQIWFKSYPFKFEGMYFHIWKHQITLLFKIENLMSIVDIIKIKIMALIIPQIIGGQQALLIVRLGSIAN